MPTISAQVDDALLRRIQKVCEWENRTQKQFVREALEGKVGQYKDQLEALEKAEENIRKTLPALNDSDASVRVKK